MESAADNRILESTGFKICRKTQKESVHSDTHEHGGRKYLKNMVKGCFGDSTETYYIEFINALLHDNVRKMNTFMNKVALNTFSSFDRGNKLSEQTEPERFYHGFVLGMVVNMADTYIVRLNRESGYGYYDIMLEPVDKSGKTFIFEFKVLDPDEETPEDTLAAAHRKIAGKNMRRNLYHAELRQRKYADTDLLFGEGNV